MELENEQAELLQGERFAFVTEPTLSFARRTVWINMACLKCLPDMFYVHFLLFRQSRKFMIIPGKDDTLNVVRWCTPTGKPRKITCDTYLWNDIISLMDWNENSRYKLLGRFLQTTHGGGLAFDLTRAQEFTLNTINSHPANQTWEEHCQNPLVNRFVEDTLITSREDAHA